MANTSNYIKGGEIILFKDGSQIAFAQSHTLSINGETQDVSNKDAGNGTWSSSEVSKMSWEISAEHMVNANGTNVTDLYDAMVAMTPIDVVLAKSTGVEGENGITTWAPLTNSFGFKGKATITSLEISAQNGEYATFSITLAGTGALKKVSES